MTSALFSPFRLADLNLANRIVVSPMCQYSADDGVANPPTSNAPAASPTAV
jgi:2,4-dienoyl-CoA reductase-like NADH-dependent reductase (Old Yellow Enzyme family)